MRRAPLGAIGGLLAMLAAGSPLVAQTRSSTEVGFASVNFPLDGLWLNGPWVRVQVENETLQHRVRGGATLLASRAAINASADLDAWWRRALQGGLAGEVGGEASAVTGDGSRSNATLVGGARLTHTLGDGGGVAIRGTGSVSWREAGPLGGRGLDVAAWWRLPGATLSATVLREETQGQLFTGPLRSRFVGVVPVRYTEATAGFTSAAEWGSLTLTGGARRDPDADQRTEGTWSATVMEWIAPAKAVVVSVARQPDDFIHGADGSLSMSIAFRFSGALDRAATAAPRGPVVVVDPGTRRLHIHAPGASRVEVMADFTDWETVALTHEGDGFVLPTALAPGAHRLMVRIDDGAWRAPVNLPSVDDDYGGRVGLLAVEP